ncbi:MAG: CDP-alcohol phosphatidyltransferase family protein [Arachnia sp.]
MAGIEPIEQGWDTLQVWTIPNALSTLRLLGVGVFGWLILSEQDLAAAILLAAFGATDWLDGFLARRLQQRSPLGARLDPIADRLYILMALVALAVRGILPWWLLAVLAARDLMLVGLLPSLRRSGRVALPVNLVGKAATMCLLIAFPLILIAAADSDAWQWAWWLGWPLALLGAALYWWAGLKYLAQTIALARARRGTR